MDCVFCIMGTNMLEVFWVQIKLNRIFKVFFESKSKQIQAELKGTFLFITKLTKTWIIGFSIRENFKIFSLSLKIKVCPWSFQLLSCSPSTTGLALRFTLVCYNSDDSFKTFIVRSRLFGSFWAVTQNFVGRVHNQNKS